MFEQGGTGEDLPTVTLSADEAAQGQSIVQLFVRSGLAKSGKDAKRLIAEGGARLNDALVSDPGLVLQMSDLSEPVKLTAGRKRHAMITVG